MTNKQQFTAQYISNQHKPSEPAFLYKLLKKFEIHRFASVLDVISAKNKVSVLDIGCGKGDFLFANQELWSSMAGVDILEESIAKARMRNSKIPATFAQLAAGSQKLPFRKSAFDLVVSIATLQYLDDLELLFSEVSRVLKKNGVFIFEVPNFVVVWRRLQLLFGQFPHTSLFHQGWDGGVIHYFSQPRLEAFCQEQGFIVDTVTCSEIFARFRSVYPSLLGANLIFVCRKK